jgi:hypothetical protein
MTTQSCNMSELAQILQRLDNFENRMRDEQLQTRHAMNTRLDNMSDQLGGVVNDFTTLGDNLYNSFNQWGDRAASDVVDAVLAVHGPRIEALHGYIRGIRSCNWYVILSICLDWILIQPTALNHLGHLLFLP